MVEFLMVFALGALTALLGGLLVLPALNARAQRLQRRKLEALYPMSIAEITAERDHVRAEMAVQARRTEIRAEATAREKASDLIAIGNRDMQIFRLNESIAAHETTIGNLQSDLSGTRAQLTHTEAVRDKLDADLSGTKAALGSLTNAHETLQQRFDKTDAQLSQTRQTLLLTQSTLTATEAESQHRGEALAAMTAAHKQMQALADERQMVIVSAQTRIEILESEKQELQRRMADAGNRIAQLETALRAAEGDARDARSFVAENSGKLDEARAALSRLETRQLAQQRAIDTAKQKAREDRNAAQAASLALVKAEAEIRRLNAKMEPAAPRSPSPRTSSPAAKTGVTEARIVRMNRSKPDSKETAANTTARVTKPHREAAE